jgi:hypothetical protein
LFFARGDVGVAWFEALGSGPGRKMAAQRSYSRQSKYVFASRYLCASRASNRSSAASLGMVFGVCGGRASDMGESTSVSESSSSEEGRELSNSAALVNISIQARVRHHNAMGRRTISLSDRGRARCKLPPRLAAVPSIAPHRPLRGCSCRQLSQQQRDAIALAPLYSHSYRDVVVAATRVLMLGCLPRAEQWGTNNSLAPACTGPFAAEITSFTACASTPLFDPAYQLLRSSLPRRPPNTSVQDAYHFARV